MVINLERILGVWKEYVEDEYINDKITMSLPSIYTELFDKSQIDAQVLHYLNHESNVFFALRGGATEHKCLIRKNTLVSMSVIYTDGVYVWTDLLIEYYMELGLLLPKEFIEFIYLRFNISSSLNFNTPIAVYESIGKTYNPVFKLIGLA